ncbi:hypothetical protein AVEN_264831-1 [Araneus ventricosus]|uniref:Uncharacterized protein n=1 Tax=Araneus ventricosus TaxID=182803 RepID=A0A4Y2E050_ARAVE|nr:hypothetical protein AVEN_264831-1 [Araneus ventricosus]
MLYRKLQSADGCRHPQHKGWSQSKGSSTQCFKISADANRQLLGPRCKQLAEQLMIDVLSPCQPDLSTCCCLLQRAASRNSFMIGNRIL